MSIMQKTISLLFVLAFFLSSCGNSAQTEAKQMEANIKAMRPGGIPTTEGGWTMTAKLDGKSWSASSIISPKAAGRICGDDGGESISLPYDRREMIVGKKIKISENNAVDLMAHDEVVIWAGYEGEIEITRADEEWAEGKFHFTASSSSTSKTIQVTDGMFRISMINN